jgi:hypothetical protein
MKEERRHHGVHTPLRGQLLRDYSFMSAAGESVQLTGFRGKWNLVIVAVPGPIDASQTHLLRSLAKKSPQVRENETRVLVVTRPEHLATVVNLGDDFLFLADTNGEAMLELGADDALVVYITDKFREVIHRIDVADTSILPTAEEIVSWTEFAVMQCPECHPPEWPADEVA